MRITKRKQDYLRREILPAILPAARQIPSSSFLPSPPIDWARFAAKHKSKFPSVKSLNPKPREGVPDAYDIQAHKILVCWDGHKWLDYDKELIYLAVKQYLDLIISDMWIYGYSTHVHDVLSHFKAKDDLKALARIFADEFLLGFICLLMTGHNWECEANYLLPAEAFGTEKSIYLQFIEQDKTRRTEKEVFVYGGLAAAGTMDGPSYHHRGVSGRVDKHNLMASDSESVFAKNFGMTARHYEMMRYLGASNVGYFVIAQYGATAPRGLYALAEGFMIAGLGLWESPHFLDINSLSQPWQRGILPAESLPRGINFRLFLVPDNGDELKLQASLVAPSCCICFHLQAF